VSPDCIDLITEPLPGDRVALRWTDPARREVCEAVFELDQLAAMERGEVVHNPPSIERTNLDDAIASLEARQEGIEVRKADLLDRYPDLGEEGSQ
jgi:hypothetical protein